MLLKIRSLLYLVWILAWAATAQAQAEDHASIFQPFQTLLSQYLIERDQPGGGLISAFDYEAALADGQTDALLADQRERLAGFDPAQLAERQQAVAFWINAYNFFMVDQLLTERPDGELVSSVWDFGGRYSPFVDSVFDRQRFVIGGRHYSLNQIEKDILLGAGFQARGWKDARVHFAVNCASVGCPPLRATIYRADNLEALLTDNTRRAFNSPRHLRLASGELQLTALFKWYQSDFVEAEGSVPAFIRRWAAPQVVAQLDDNLRIQYIDYDWALNRPANVWGANAPEPVGL